MNNKNNAQDDFNIENATSFKQQFTQRTNTSGTQQFNIQQTTSVRCFRAPLSFLDEEFCNLAFNEFPVPLILVCTYKNDFYLFSGM